jgi:hypothetical protein
MTSFTIQSEIDILLQFLDRTGAGLIGYFLKFLETDFEADAFIDHGIIFPKSAFLILYYEAHPDPEGRIFPLQGAIFSFIPDKIRQ